MELMASPSNMEVTPFSRPLPEPKRMMSIKIPHATLKPVRKVLSLLRDMLAAISCHLSMSNM
jgi:hypothetical protein